MTNWDDRWFEVARTFASFSKDPSTKVGAIAVVDQRPVAYGWNGFPRGVADLPERLNDREKKYPLTVHAEMNCIYNAGYHGVSLRGATMYVYGLPVCQACALGIIQSGVSSVKMRYDDASDKWEESFNRTAALFREVGLTWEVVL